MTGNYKLTVTWDAVPGLPRESISMEAPDTMVAAALKELCSSSYALTGLKELHVKVA